MIYIFYYFIVLIILILIEIKLESRINNFLKMVIYDVEKFFYNFYIELLNNKAKIVNYKKSLELFFIQRNKFLRYNHYSLYDIDELISQSQKEKEYLNELLGTQNYYNNNIKEQINEIYTICYIKHYLRILIYFLTLGIYYFISSGKKYC